MWIHRYIASRNPSATDKTVRLIEAAVQRLLMFPQLGRPTDQSEVRLVQVPGRPYLLPYRVGEDVVEIIAVFDERMERPPEWT